MTIYFNERPVLIEQSSMHYIVSVTADEGVTTLSFSS